MSPLGAFHPSPYSSPRERLSSKLDYVEDDKQSTISQASGTPRAEQGLDTLRLVAGNRVRHAHCAPEYLEEIAAKGVQESIKKATSKKFKVISGSEARSYFKNYVEQYHKKESKKLRIDNDSITKHGMLAPIIFAVTVWEGGSKCVDYHMTWRGISKVGQSADVEREVNWFDTQFRRLARALDKEYQRISSLTTYRSISQTHRKFDTKPRSSSSSHKSHSSHKSRPPPGITVSSPEELSSKPDNRINPSLPEPPVSAADSVMSLPLLNMVRGVPLSHHLPLRVTNPDRLSLISAIDIVPGPASVSPPEPKVHADANNLSVPALSRSSKHAGSKDSVKRSSDSILSSDTRSTKSSRSSRSSSPSGHYSSRNTSPGDHIRDGDLARRGKHGEEFPEFLIVLLGTSLDKDENSWHGLDRQTSIRSVPAERHSPWIGPLARPHSMGDRRHTPTRTPNDSDSEASDDDPDHWKNIPVIPMKPLMESMGLIPNVSSYYSHPVVPHSSIASLSNAGSPMANQSPYLYWSPRLDCSPYPPAWLPQMQAPSHASSRPPSMTYSATSQLSPYIQTHASPF